MFLPIYDGVPLRNVRKPLATWVLIAINLLALIATSSGVIGQLDKLDVALGVIPAVVFDYAVRSPDLSFIPVPFTFLTSMFIHAGFWHFAGNMLFLWVFGDNVEDAMGSRRFVVFYLTCGVLAAFVHAIMTRDSQAPLIGASGAVSGVLAAYLMLYPRVRVYGLIFSWLPIVLPAYVFVGSWIALQFASALLGGDSQTGWWAHVGGVIAGGALVAVFKRPDFLLFAPASDEGTKAPR